MDHLQQMEYMYDDIKNILQGSYQHNAPLSFLNSNELT